MGIVGPWCKTESGAEGKLEGRTTGIKSEGMTRAGRRQSRVSWRA